MKKYILVLLTALLCGTASQAQHQVKGKVVDLSDGAELPLTGAFVRWMDNESGTYANEIGEFSINHTGEEPFLVVSYIGYATDTFDIEQMNQFITIELVSDALLGGTTVRAKRITYGLQSKDAKFTFNLDEREFQKAACCNLSESFENAPAIDVSIADAVTGTKQIKMLGLDGFYTLISKEYMPAIRTLNSYYGLSLVPASWVESMQITKGAGSVVNGYESMAGQINIQMKNPFGADKFMLDQFVSQAGRSETDLMYRHDLNKYVSTSGFARIALYPGMIDNNDDGFMDMPAGNQYSFMNRWKFATDKHLEGELTGSYLLDNKKAGQLDYFKNDDTKLYGVSIQNEQWDVVAKLGKGFHDKPYQSFGSQYNANGSSIESTYGSDSTSRTYIANSKTFYGNFLFQSIFGNTNHSFQTGLSFMGDLLTEEIDGRTYDRTELVPGAFMEYTYKPSEILSVVTGLRTDYNSIFGWSVTPRLHTRVRFNGNTSVRASIGTGRRTSNIFAQHQYLLASERSIEVIRSNYKTAYGLEQEVSVNSGFSIEHKFKLGYIPSSIVLDYFNTTFKNEVVVDREVPGLVRFYNQENGTTSNSFQLQLDLNPMRRTDIRMAYRMFDVNTTYKVFPHALVDYAEETYSTTKPFVARHRAFVNLTQSNRNQWQLSTTLQWTGQQRIAGSSILYEGAYVSDHSEQEFSDAYFQWNAQVSKTLKKHPFEIFVGMENILNYQQPNPIYGAEDPFQSNFDAGMVWGPIFGRMIYGGFRWRIKKSYNDKLKEDHTLNNSEDHEI